MGLEAHTSTNAKATCTAILCGPTHIPALDFVYLASHLTGPCEVIGSCDNYVRVGSRLSWFDVSIISNINSAKFQNEQTAAKVMEFIDAARWIEAQINLKLHTYLSGHRNSLNLEDREIINQEARSFWEEISVLLQFKESTNSSASVSSTTTNTANENEIDSMLHSILRNHLPEAEREAHKNIVSGKMQSRTDDAAYCRAVQYSSREWRQAVHF